MDAISDLVSNPIFWTATLGLAAIIATLVAPRFGSRGKITFTVKHATPIRLNRTHDAVSVVYAVNGEAVGDNIYVAEFEFRNIGSKDITQSAFQQPIKIELPQESRILSTECEQASPCTVQISNEGRCIGLSWDILKRREIVKLTCVFATQQDSKVRARDFKPICRLIDVDLLDADKSNFFRALRNSLLVVAIGFCALCFLYSRHDLGVSKVVGQVDGSSKPIVANESFTQLYVCEAQKNIWAIRSCDELSSSGMQSLELSFVETPVGVRVDYAVLALIFLLTYSFPIALVFANNRLVAAARLIIRAVLRDSHSKERLSN